MARVVVRDLGWGRISRELRALERARGQVGVWSGASYPDGADVAEVAGFMEWGTASVPSRGFMRQAADDADPTLLAYTRGQLLALYVSGLSARGMVANVAAHHAEQVRGSVRTASSWAVPLAPSTAAAKGHSRPLYDSGLLLQSITYRVL